jgi:hypothetical protein
MHRLHLRSFATADDQPPRSHGKTVMQVSHARKRGSFAWLEESGAGIGSRDESEESSPPVVNDQLKLGTRRSHRIVLTTHG